jgi:comEA protein
VNSRLAALAILAALLAITAARVPKNAPVAQPLETTSESVLVDLNEADAEALDSLPGIGPARARAILDLRAERGRFASVDDLLDVPGIGPAIVEDLRPLVTTGGGPP